MTRLATAVVATAALLVPAGAAQAQGAGAQTPDLASAPNVVPPAAGKPLRGPAVHSDASKLVTISSARTHAGRLIISLACPARAHGTVTLQGGSPAAVQFTCSHGKATVTLPISASQGAKAASKTGTTLRVRIHSSTSKRDTLAQLKIAAPGSGPVARASATLYGSYLNTSYTWSWCTAGGSVADPGTIAIAINPYADWNAKRGETIYWRGWAWTNTGGWQTKAPLHWFTYGDPWTVSASDIRYHADGTAYMIVGNTAPTSPGGSLNPDVFIVSPPKQVFPGLEVFGSHMGDYIYYVHVTEAQRVAVNNNYCYFNPGITTYI